MYLASVRLIHFRNMESLTADFSPGRNLIIGKNGQGKTNLLEAFYFLSHARSHRTGRDRELVMAGSKEGGSIRAALKSSSESVDSPTLLEARFIGSNEIEAVENKPTSRFRTQCRLNGAPLKSRSQLLGHFPTVSFFLSDLLLLRGSPADRRRWLDAAATQFDSQHFHWVITYQRLREQKAHFLKNLSVPIPSSARDLLEVWNDQLVQAGAQLTYSRIQYLNYLLKVGGLLELHDELTGGKDSTLKLLYGAKIRWVSPDSTEALPTLEDLRRILVEDLKIYQAEEIRKGVCLVGPHREDIRILLGAFDASTYASQGQQRTVVLALKLAELEVLKDRLGHGFTLLLDDVMAELDPDRQQFLLGQVGSECQVFLTTTHLENTVLQHLGVGEDRVDTSFFTMQGGVLWESYTQPMGAS